MRSPRLLTLVFATWLGHALQAQCGPVISAFPYQEGFETDPAWTSGGLANDWDWGTPAHPIINSAGEGSKSWCVGGLTGQFYQFDAQSWLMSPCFDFSALDNPWISFQIFWEVERTYDGLVLQYSLDQGLTWDNVGAYNDPENCLDQNWYNTNNIINLDEANPKHGWSGRQGNTSGSCQGGQGSGGWITASHCMAELANEPSVRFRFLFGSGSTCNNFDGIGIDAVLIGEPTPLDLETSYTCDAQQVSFSAIAPCAASILWDFGDPGAGAANSATGAATAHTYNTAGQYTVTTTVLGPCGPALIQTLDVTVLGLEITATNATCGQPNGYLEAFVTGSNGPFVFDWQPGGGVSQVFDGLAEGTYTLTVSGSGICPATASASIQNEGSLLQVNVSHTDVTCNGYSDGTATAAFTGSATAEFLWSPTGGDQAEATGLSVGDYTVTVIGDNGCEVTGNVTISGPDALIVSIDPEVGLCAGATATLEPGVTGGTGATTLVWIPDGPDVSPATTTVYEVTATDVNGCVSNTATTTVNVGAAIVPTISVDVASGCSPLCVAFTPGPAGLSAYSFDYGDGVNGADPTHCYVRPGLFDVVLTATDDAGCSGSTLFPGLIESFPRPTAGFTVPETVIISDGPLRVIDGSTGATQWLWDFDGADGDVNGADPLVSFPAIDCYTLRQIVTNDFSCSDTATAEVCVENEFALYAPNAFTPNGDGFNEVFGVVTTVRSPSHFVFRVFDRWGNECFTSNEVDQGWAGEKAENGVYAWRVELRDSEGKLKKASGHVVLIR